MGEANTVVICVLVADMATSMVPGSSQERCPDCGRNVWVAARTRERFRDGEVAIRCLPCALVRATPDMVKKVLEDLKSVRESHSNN